MSEFLRQNVVSTWHPLDRKLFHSLETVTVIVVYTQEVGGTCRQPGELWQPGGAIEHCGIPEAAGVDM